MFSRKRSLRKLLDGEGYPPCSNIDKQAESQKEEAYRRKELELLGVIRLLQQEVESLKDTVSNLESKLSSPSDGMRLLYEANLTLEVDELNCELNLSMQRELHQQNMIEGLKRQNKALQAELEKAREVKENCEEQVEEEKEVTSEQSRESGEFEKRLQSKKYGISSPYLSL